MSEQDDQQRAREIFEACVSATNANYVQTLEFIAAALAAVREEGRADKHELSLIEADTQRVT